MAVLARYGSITMADKNSPGCMPLIRSNTPASESRCLSSAWPLMRSGSRVCQPHSNLGVDHAAPQLGQRTAAHLSIRHTGCKVDQLPRHLQLSIGLPWTQADSACWTLRMAKPRLLCSSIAVS